MEAMGVHGYSWTSCCSSSSCKLQQPFYLRLKRLDKASNSCNGSSISRRVIAGSLRIGVEDIAEIVHNKVLISAAASAAIGQLSKPFTSAFLYRKGFDLRAAAQPGGFPSTHSSAVVAVATSLALERGFSDSVFGLAAVYAAIVMYDAQGVRMEVGKHAQVMNRVLLNNSTERNVDFSKITSNGVSSCSSERTVHEEAVGGSYNSRTAMASTLLRQDDLVEEEMPEEAVGISGIVIAPLKETVGHTRVEVMAGALLGFFTGLAVSASGVI